MKSLVKVSGMDSNRNLKLLSIMKAWIVLFGIVYTFGYGFLAFLALDFGKGSGVFLAPLIGFFGLSWIALLTGLGLATGTESKGKRNYFFIAMGCHYLLTAIWLFVLWPGNVTGTQYLWEHQPKVVWVTLGSYIAGQLMIWVIFLSSSRKAAKRTLP